MPNYWMIAMFDLWAIQIPAPVALGVIAVVGYLFGRSANKKQFTDTVNARRELKRAQLVAKQLEKIAEVLRKDLAKHHSSVARFKDRVATLNGKDQEAGFQDLCREAEEVLAPTMRLASQLSHAYDEIRQQTNSLMSFTEVRTDPLTGISNRRALDEALDTLEAMHTRYDTVFSIAILDIDHFKQVNDLHGHLEGDRALQEVAAMIDDCVRETDLVARYGGEEFVVVMPNTALDGARCFADRLRRKIDSELSLTVSGGVATILPGEKTEGLLGRADQSLYGAKSAGRNRIYYHDGEEIHPTNEKDEPSAQPELAVETAT